MKKILLTGSDGFIGRHLCETLAQRPDYRLHCPSQADVDLTASHAVASCLAAFKPDIIIHSATSNTIGKGYESDVCEQNLRMFFNLLRYRPTKCTLYILCSGSSYGREHWVDEMSEDYLGAHIPSDGQGFSKFVIAAHARHLEKVITLRLFGIFGRYEDYRYKFISNTIAKRVMGMDVVLCRDARYHYLDVEDFCLIQQKFIDHDIDSGEFNVTPDKSASLQDIIRMVDRCLGIEKSYAVLTPGLGRPYTATNEKLRSTLGNNLSFTPLAVSIARLVAHYRENSHLIDHQALRQDQFLNYAKTIN